MRTNSKDKVLFAAGEMIQLMAVNKPKELAQQLCLISELLKKKSNTELFSLTSERIKSKFKDAGLEFIASAHSDLIIGTVAIVLTSNKSVVLAFNEAKAKKENEQAELEAYKL